MAQRKPWPATLKEQLQLVATDERAFLEYCLSVLDRRTGQVQPWRFNSVQDWYEANGSGFDLILKARKQGFSTRLIGRAVHRCAFRKNQHAEILTHDEQSAKVMLEERVKRLIKSSLLPLGAIEREDHVFFPGSDSRLFVGTAGTRDFGRSKDVTMYHLSEAAYYKDPGVIVSVEEAVTEDACGYIETTANGENFLKQLWDRSRRGESRYKPVFVPWFLDSEYRVPGGTIDNPSEDELRLMQVFGVDQEQLAWRRKKIKDMSDPGLFPQEYPATAEEAFLSSGRMVFDWVALLSHEKVCREPAWLGSLRDHGDSVDLMVSPRGHLSVWEVPQARRHYVIGADIAEGVKGGCYSAAFVLDVERSRQVAEWHGHIPPDQFGDVLALLGLYYNTALLAPEAWPGCGAVTAQRLIDLGYRNIWKRPSRGSGRSDDQLYGWETTARTRQPMLLELAAAIRDFELAIVSRGLLEELRSFVYDEDNDMVPALGCYSDRVMAAGIAWKVSRDLAAGVVATSGRPRLRELERAVIGGGAVSAPQWRGSRYGVKAA